MRVSPDYTALSGVGVAGPDVQSKAQSATDTIIESIGKIIPLWQQQKIFNAQLAIEKQRAAQAGGALDVSNIQLPGMPVQVGVPQSTNTILIAGIGILALVLLMSQRRSR